ncbi:MAG TPA: hypothetical protein VNV66_04365 [Pilimelia sp.]|nr:hypothetical protein [Pilimelia sp.]
MDSGPLRSLTIPGVAIPAPRRVRPTALAPRPVPDLSAPDEPTAVIVVGATGRERRAVVAALLGLPPRALPAPGGASLVIGYGQPGPARAYVPGCRAPQPVPSGPAADPPGGPAAAGPGQRPARRVELRLPEPLLRHFAVVDLPDLVGLAAAGGGVLADAARRGGAVLWLVGADVDPPPAELRAVAALAGTARLFVAVTTGPAQPAGPDPVARLRARTAATHPALATVPWFGVDPGAGDVAFLRRALIDWSDEESLARAGANPTTWPGASAAVPLRAPDTGRPWAEVLDAWPAAALGRLRGRLGRSVAELHQRCVRELDADGPGPDPVGLDRGLHALSLLLTVEADGAVATLTDDVLRRVLRDGLTEAVRRRVVAAVRRDLADDGGAGLDRVLLVTGTAGVAALAGPEALAALPVYPAAARWTILPPLGLALSAGCYQVCRVDPGRGREAELDRVRQWLRRAADAVEAAVVAELDRRFTAVHRSLGGLLAESVDHGLLLA